MATFHDIATRKGVRSVYMLEITLTRGATAETLRMSDHDCIVGDYQFAGLVQSWGSIQWGIGNFAQERYSQPDIHLVLFVDHALDQERGHNILDKLNAFYWVGAPVAIYRTFRELGTAEYTSREKVFSGAVYSLPQLSADRVEVKARADVETDVIANKEITKADYPDVRPRDLGKFAPVVVGEVGAFIRSRLYEVTSTNEQSVWDTLFSSYAAMVDNGVPCPVTDFEDTSNLEVLVNSFRINSAQFDANKPILGCMWGGDAGNAGVIAGLTDSDVDEANGVVKIPVTDKAISISRTFLPPSNEAHIKYTVGVGQNPPFSDIDSSVTWSNWWRAFDRDRLDTFAVQVPGDAPVLSEPMIASQLGADFITPPPGGTLSGIDNTAQAHFLWALVYVEKDPGGAGTWNIVLETCWDDGTSNGDWDADAYTHSVDGYYLIIKDLKTKHLAFVNDVRAGTWGGDVLDYISVFGLKGQTQLLHVHLWGLQFQFDDCGVSEAFVAHDRGEARQGEDPIPRLRQQLDHHAEGQRARRSDRASDSWWRGRDHIIGYQHDFEPRRTRGA
jgi:hypothetical protein